MTHRHHSFHLFLLFLEHSQNGLLSNPNTRIAVTKTIIRFIKKEMVEFIVIS